MPGAEQCRDPGQTGGPDDGAGGDGERGRGRLVVMMREKHLQPADGRDGL